MSTTLSRVVGVILFATLLGLLNRVSADVYMHNPRGSNDRNCETNENRNNGNRLFDSQNNAKGGYACPRAVGGPDVKTGRMYYYAGSKLRIEWTHQHSCGTGNAYCDIILQYMCEDGNPKIRDGTPENEVDPATDTVPFDPNDPAASDGTRYGMHETHDYYKRCRTRRRNAGLFLADQKISRESSATRTRQNPNGNRNGLECPEERDYYPYWHPTPWKDIAIFTSNVTRCNIYRRESQNVSPKGDCRKGTSGANLNEALVWNNEKDCIENGGHWITFPAHNLPAPDCFDSAMIWTRDNHLGNTHNGYMAHYNWTIPNDIRDSCVLRLRYNISTADYDPYLLDSSRNWELSPVKQDQFNGGPIQSGENPNEVYPDKGYGWETANAINTNQYGRTFQDRSYLFSIKRRPSSISPKAVIWNLNVRGKRGNIVQTYPAVEYDFVPNFLILEGGDYLHIQWTGSDYNPNRQPNDAEGGPPYLNTNQARADRNNLMQMDNSALNMARKIDDVTMFLDEKTGTPKYDVIRKLALLDQPIGQKDSEGNPKCLTYSQLRKLGLNQNDAERDARNCGKINGATTPYFDAGLVRMVASGHFKYYSSRNNNFSNRSQKGEIVVVNGWFAAASHLQASIVAVLIVALATLGFLF